MDNKKAAEILRAIKVGTAHAFLNDDAITSALDTAIAALEKQEQVNTQSVNLTHTTYPNALESLKILESAKDENGCVPMSLVRLAFRNVLEQDRWISVTERFPEIHKDVLVTDREVSDVYVSYYCGGGYWNTDTGGANNRIIAWRPLPEPYTEDEA